MNNLQLVRKIYNMLYGKPTSHQQWADSFNKIGDIKKNIR